MSLGPCSLWQVLWNFGNDATFSLLTNPVVTKRFPKKTRQFKRPDAYRTVLLRHDDALLLNVERVVHGVEVKQRTGARSAECPSNFLPGRRASVAIRPALQASSPNADDFLSL